MSSFRALTIAATGMNAQQTAPQAVLHFAGRVRRATVKGRPQAETTCFEVSRTAI